MLKTLLLSFAIFIGTLSFAQESSFDFSYVFKFEGVTEPADAKSAILEMRELLGVKAIRFNNDTDEFNILTHLDYEVEELTFDLESIGFTFVSVLIKTYLG